MCEHSLWILCDWVGFDSGIKQSLLGMARGVKPTTLIFKTNKLIYPF